MSVTRREVITGILSSGVGLWPAAAKGTVTKLRLFTSLPASDYRTALLDVFSIRLSAFAEVEAQWSMEPGDPRTSVEALRSGAADLILTGPLELSKSILEFDVLDTCLAFGASDFHQQLFASPPMDSLRSAADEVLGLRILCPLLGVPENLCINVSAKVTGPGDLNGLVIGVPQFGGTKFTVEALGATAKPLSLTDRIEAYRAKEIDGLICSHATMRDFKLFPATKQIVAFALIPEIRYLAMSSKKWASLSAGQQEAVMRGANEYAGSCSKFHEGLVAQAAKDAKKARVKFLKPNLRALQKRVLESCAATASSQSWPADIVDAMERLNR